MTNVLLVTADDMRFDHWQYMPTVRRRLGFRFLNHRVNTAVCGPERVGILTGQWSRDHGVFDGAGTGVDVSTTGPGCLPMWLDTAGVSTAQFGKYIQTADATRAGPWDVVRMLVNNADVQDTYAYSVYDKTTTTQPGLVQPGVHIDDYLAAQFDTWLSTVIEPWFAWVCPTTPHVDQTEFTCNAHPDDVASWLWLHHDLDEESDVSDKPSWLQSGGALTPSQVAYVWKIARRQIQELNALDRAVGTMLDSLVSMSMLDDTIVMFTSDNGVHYAEHGYTQFFTSDKNTNYEYCVHVPLAVTGPGFPAVGTSLAPTCAQDITATAVAVAGATPTLGAQVGVDLRDLVSPTAEQLDRTLLHRVQDTSAPYPTAGVSDALTVAGETKFIEWIGQTGSDQYELYDLTVDPGEKENLANDVGYAATVAFLAAALSTLRGD